MTSLDVNPKYSANRISDIVLTLKLFSPVKILSFAILRQPVITANLRLSFVLSADSNKERINVTISS